MSPSTSIMRPAGPRVGVGQRVTSTVTIWPGSASFVSARGIWMSAVSRLSNGATKPRPDAIDLVASDDGAGGALEHLDDASFGAAVFAVALDAHDHAIAVHGVLQVVLGNVDVARQSFDRSLGRDESESGRMAIELADHQIHADRAGRSGCL